MFVIVSRALCLSREPLLLGLELALGAAADLPDERLAPPRRVLAEAGLRDLPDAPPPLREDEDFGEALCLRPRVAACVCAEALDPLEGDRPPDLDLLDEPRDALVAIANLPLSLLRATRRQPQKCVARSYPLVK
jgi:hypothetical protein